MRRLPGGRYSGARKYFLTLVTKDRRPYLVNRQIVASCHEQVSRAAEAERFRALAVCYMPDHVHMLVEGCTGDADVIAFVKSAKQFSGYHVKRRHGIALWAKGYHDRIVREDDDVRGYVAYIRNNPVAAGLVTTPDEYPFTWIDPAWIAGSRAT